MHLHEKRPRRRPFHANRPHAWQYRHRLLGAGTGGHAAGIVGGAGCQHSRGRVADHVRRDHAVHRLAADSLADQPYRAADAAHNHARGAGLWQSRLGLCAGLYEPPDHPPGDACSRRALYAAGCRYGGANRAGEAAWQHDCLHLSRLVARCRSRPSADHLHRKPLCC
jgi:hypothetical protein